MKISDMKFSLTVYSDGVSLQWEKFSDDARYVLVRKKISNPTSMFDGNRVYIGTETSYEDYKVVNGEIYYYRLFVLPDPNDDFANLTDNQLSLRVIALQFSEGEDYSEYLYGSLPKNVRYSDATLKGQNKPLQRFIRLFCYPFNKLNVYTDSMLNQIDVDTCDEIYLPYHAKWLGRFYDERFGSDINRLLLKTLEEAEPYIGTKMGLEYILQRVFKAEVEISERITNSCFTNDSKGLLSNTLMTNGCICVESIKLYFDDDNAWLTTDVASSILRLIVEYCPIRLGLEIISSLVSYETYDRQRMEDDYLHDCIIEVINDRVVRPFEDELYDSLDLGGFDVNEHYKGFGNISLYPNSSDPTFGTTTGNCLISKDLFTCPTRYNTNMLGSVGIENLTNGSGRLCQELKTVSMGYNCDSNTMESSSLTNRDKERISHGIMTNPTFYENSVVSYADTIVESNSDEYDTIVDDVYKDNAFEHSTEEYERVQTEEEKSLLTLTESYSSMINEVYKMGGNIRSYLDSDKIDFGLTSSKDMLLSHNLVTNAVRFGVVGSTNDFNLTNGTGLISEDIRTVTLTYSGEGKLVESSSLTNRDKELLSSGLLTNAQFEDRSVISYGDKFITTDYLEYDGASEDKFSIEIITESEQEFQKAFEDELESIGKDAHNEVLMLVRFGMTNEAFSLLSNSMLTNVRGRRNDIETMSGLYSKTNSNATSNNMNTNSLYTSFDYKDVIVDKDNLEYSGANEESDSLQILQGNSEILSLTNSVGLISNNLILGIGSDADETLDKSFDEEFIDTQKTTNEETSDMLSKVGVTNSGYSLTTKASTNAKNTRLLDSDDLEMQQSLDSFYSGVKAIFEATTILNSAMEVMSMLNGIGLLNGTLKTGSGIRNDDEVAKDYSDDDDIVSFIRTRPESLICSACVLSRSFYTTDISY